MSCIRFQLLGIRLILCVKLGCDNKWVVCTLYNEYLVILKEPEQIFNVL